MPSEPKITELKPGGCYVVTTDQRVSRDQAQALRDAFEKEAPGVKLIVLSGGLEITELNDEQLASVGLKWEA